MSEQPEKSQCGFVHDRWLDGIHRERRRCIAPAGHSGCPLAYDHGPWQSVPEPRTTEPTA